MPSRAALGRAARLHFQSTIGGAFAREFRFAQMASGGATYLMPIAMECGPTKCSTRVAEKPASRIQA
jgi:hypothetical protein